MTATIASIRYPFQLSVRQSELLGPFSNQVDVRHLQPGSSSQRRLNSMHMIGQIRLALNCGTDRDDETAVLSRSFLRHIPPFCISTAFWIFSRPLSFFYHFENPISPLDDELSLSISSRIHFWHGCLGPWFQQTQRRLPCSDHSPRSSKQGDQHYY